MALVLCLEVELVTRGFSSGRFGHRAGCVAGRSSRNAEFKGLHLEQINSGFEVKRSSDFPSGLWAGCWASSHEGCGRCGHWFPGPLCPVSRLGPRPPWAAGLASWLFACFVTPLTLRPQPLLPPCDTSHDTPAPASFTFIHFLLHRAHSGHLRVW